MPSKLWKIVGVVHPIKSKQDLRAISGSWWIKENTYGKNHCQIIMKNKLQEKGDNSLQHYNLVHKCIPMFPAMKSQEQKQRCTKNEKKSEKFSAWNLTKIRSKSEVIDEGRTSGAKVHFASVMDKCHLKNAELEAKHQKYKGRIAFRGDIVKDDSGSYAVFTEQGSSASQMTAAKIRDIISRLPGCDGQAADAVSAYTQVKMEDAHKLLKIPKSECPDIWIRLPRHKWPKSWSSMEEPNRSSWAESVRSSFGRIGMAKAIWQSFTDIKLMGKKQNVHPMWKLLNKEVDLEN